MFRAKNSFKSPIFATNAKELTTTKLVLIPLNIPTNIHWERPHSTQVDS
jgi:hypothetical protein